MLSLFDDEPLLPKGFVYKPGIITSEEEEMLLSYISTLPLEFMKFHAYTAKRKTAGFGFGWSFENRSLKAGNPIPAELHFLIRKACDCFDLNADAVAGVLVTEYPPGSVINWHRDAPPYDKIIGVSLGSDCIFRFRPYDKAKQNRYSTISLPVSARSVYLLDDESRSEWEHSTMPVKHTRYSVTLRTLK